MIKSIILFLALFIAFAFFCGFEFADYMCFRQAW